MHKNSFFQLAIKRQQQGFGKFPRKKVLVLARCFSSGKCRMPLGKCAHAGYNRGHILYRSSTWN